MPENTTPQEVPGFVLARDASRKLYLRIDQSEGFVWTPVPSQSLQFHRCADAVSFANILGQQCYAFPVGSLPADPAPEAAPASVAERDVSAFSDEVAQ